MELQALRKEIRAIHLCRLFFSLLLLHGTMTHAWETQRPLHNTHYLNPLLTNENPEVKKVAKDLLDSDPRVVKNLAPLLNKPRGELQDAGIDLAHIATTRAIDPSTTHAVLSLATLLQEENCPHLEEAQELLERLKNTKESAENCQIGREATALHNNNTK